MIPHEPLSSSRLTADFGSNFIFHHSPFIIHHFESIDSTQRRARAAAESGAAMHGVVLWAGRQSAGHGRTGRAWSSEPGGLYVTACLPEGAIPPEHLGWLPMMAALACAEEIESRLGLQPTVKWPNDLLIEGKKIAGFIGDAISTKSGDVYAIGMGLNWSNPAPAVDIPAASLMDFTQSAIPQRSTTPQFDFLVAWLDRLARRHGELAAEPRQAAERIRMDVEARLWRRGEPVRLERTEIGPVEGVLVGLGPGGSAMLEIEGRPVTAVYCGNTA